MNVKNSVQPEESVNEINLLRCKLDTKCKALLILSEDLMNCRRERDDCKAMLDQYRDRHLIFKSRIDGKTSSSISFSSMQTSETCLSQLVSQLRQKNNSLMYEIEDLRMKLYDAEGDIKILRHQINLSRLRKSDSHHSESFTAEQGSLTSQENGNFTEECMSQIEILKNRVEVLEKDLQSVLDEKEELVVIRDAYKAKVDRLNEKLNQILRVPISNGPNPRIVDIDSLMTENKFLYEKIKQMEEEKEMSAKTIARYRNMLDKGSLKKNLFSLKGRNGSTKQPCLEDLGATKVVSTKEVQAFIASNNLNNLVLSESNMSHLKSLVLALFESLSDKTSALSLQKKTNKLLGKRIQDLEAKIKDLQATENATFKTEVVVNDGSEYVPSKHHSITKEDSAEVVPESADDLEEPDEVRLPVELENLVQKEIKRLQGSE